MMAMLVSEPFHLRPWEIENLTPYQVRNIYFAERDENGSIKPRLTLPEGSITNPELLADEKYLFFRHWEANGLRKDLIEKLWVEEHGTATK